MKCFNFYLSSWTAGRNELVCCRSSQAEDTLEEKLSNQEQKAPCCGQGRPFHFSLGEFSLKHIWGWTSFSPWDRKKAKKTEPWILALHLGTGGFSMTDPYRIKGSALMLHQNKSSICCDIHGAGYLQEDVLCPNLLRNKVFFQQNYWRLMRVVLLMAPEAVLHGLPTCLLVRSEGRRDREQVTFEEFTHFRNFRLHIVVKNGVEKKWGDTSKSVSQEWVLSFIPELFSLKMKQVLLNKSFSLRPINFLLRTWGLMSTEGLIFINGLSIRKSACPLGQRWQPSYTHAGVVINNSSKQSQSCISVLTSPAEECHWIKGRGLWGHADRGH